MNKLQNKPADEEENKDTGKYPWEFMALMISLVAGGVIMGLKIAGVI